MSSVNLFNTGKSGLFANRASLATTGHNIANVNTEGYSRQRAEHVANDPSQLGNTVYGTGVRVRQVHRINDEYLTRQIGNENKILGQFDEREMALSQAEEVFNEISNAGLNRLMSRFFNEFRKLGNEPESESLRSTVRESAEQLVGDFHRISRSVRDVQKNLDVRIEANVRSVNELAQRISKLNEEIKRFEMKGGEAADLRDARDVAIKKLSNILDVNVASNEKGELTISIYNVGPLVSGTFFNKMYTRTEKADPETGKPEGAVKLCLENLAPPDITAKIKTGRLGGLLEARDRILGEANSRIDDLAFVFSKKVNEIHRQGYNIKNVTGVDFFGELTEKAGASEKLRLSNAVSADANQIATALAPDSPGDNRLIQFLGSLQNARLMSQGQSTFDDHYNATVADLATITQKTKQTLEHQQHIVNHLEKVRESISGVSLDEETTNLVQFQHAFDASAKVIKVADEMLDTILGLRR